MVIRRLELHGFGAKSEIYKTESDPIRLLKQDGELPRRPHAP